MERVTRSTNSGRSHRYFLIDQCAVEERLEGDSQHHGQAHHTPALCAENFCTFARELLQILGGQAVHVGRWREGNSLDALSGAEREGRWGAVV